MQPARPYRDTAPLTEHVALCFRWGITRTLVWITFLSSLCPVPVATQTGKPYFADVSKAANAAVRHHPPVFDYRLAHIMPMVTAGAAGGAIGDYNRDGWMDLFVNDARLGTENRLLRNNGNMTFTDVAAQAGLSGLNADQQISTMGLFFDMNGDGWQDLLVVRFGISRLFENRMDGTFADVTERAGLSRRVNALAAIAFDFDRDGDIDIYLGSYFPDTNMFNLGLTRVLHNSWEQAENGGNNVFYRNEGNGRFTEATREVGLEGTGWTMALGHGDYDNDGWQDVYVANDYGPDRLFRNTGKGRFEEVTMHAIGLDTKKGMNVEFGDYDNDGDLDIYVTNITEAFLHECNMLWRNNGDGTFTDVAAELNVCDTGWAWGAKFLDYNNDGFLDLYVANGFLTGQGDYLETLLPVLWETGEDPSDPAIWPPINGRGIAGSEPNVLFTNLRGSGFVKEYKGGVNVRSDSRAVLLADFNNDGLMDIFVTNQNAESILYLNQLENGNHWVELDLRGSPPNTDALGCRVWLQAGDLRMLRELNAGNGFGGGSALRQHFGLGKQPVIDLLEVRWPNGEVQQWRNILPDQIIQITQGKEELDIAVELASHAGKEQVADSDGLLPSAAVVNPAFIEVSDVAGVDHRHHGPAVDQRLKNLGPWFTALGAGGAVGDYNNDGFEDIYVTDSLAGHPNVLYRNEGDFTFTEVAREAGVADINDSKNFSTMALFADCDNDGWKDLLVLRFGRSMLFRNGGDGTFENISERLQMPSKRNPVAAVAFDYDRDGDLDLYLGAYFPDVDLMNVTSTRMLHDSWETARNGGTNVLLQNDGRCTFTDVTVEANLADTGWTLAVGSADIDRDGWADLYIANDFGPDKVYRNLGNGAFRDVTARAIGVDTKKGMNVDFGDYDNDGWLDVYVTNITEPFLHECNMLWRNNGDFTFTDVSEPTRTCDTDWGWAAKFLDIDNDGWLDLYALNGFISGGPKDYIDILMPIILDSDVDLTDATSWPPIGDMSFSGYEKNRLFHNDRGRNFTDVGRMNGVDSNRDGRGLLIGDFDNDGAQDMYVLNSNQEALMYRNIIGTENSWIEIRLQGTKSNRDGIGIKITFYTEHGLQYRETSAGNGFQGQSSRFVHAGFAALCSVDRILVEWPSGTMQEFRNVPTRRRYQLVEGGKLIPLVILPPKRGTVTAER